MKHSRYFAAGFMFTAFTNVGTTYKLIRRASLERLPLLIPPIDMELNAHFLDTVGLCFGWRSR